MSLSQHTPHPNARSLGLDLLRAAAILLVMAAHWSNNILHWFGIVAKPRLYFSGNLGIDLFFALSGFLIGRILIQQATQDPSVRNLGVFLVRRWMRTLPLYFLVMAVLLVFFPPPEAPFRYLLKFATMTQNLLSPMPPGWYAVSWSLAIEEWFYLLFGCAAFASFRVFPSQWAIWPPTIAFIVLPLILRLAFSGPPGGLAQTVPFRLDEIAYGVAMAQLHTKRAGPFRHPMLCLGCGLTLLALMWQNRLLGPSHIPPALVPNATVIGCALLLPAALDLRSMSAWLRRTVTTISVLSYGLYLTHHTILEGVAQPLVGHRTAPIWFGVTIAVLGPLAVAYLSFRYFEEPILRRRPSHRAVVAELPVKRKDAADLLAPEADVRSAPRCGAG